MSWIRVDDRAPEHRKQLAAGPTACWLWVCGLAYANRQPARDGFVPAAVLPMLYPIPSVAKHADRLVDAGLWERVEGGYQIHDFLDYQPGKVEVEQARARKAAAGRAGGLKSGATRRSKNEAGHQAHAKHGASPSASEATKPHPIPSHPLPEEIAPPAPLTLSGEPDTPPDLEALKRHYVERFAATHDGQAPTFKSWSKAMASLRELLALRGSLDAARAVVTHAFADPWTAKNRPQPWELVADVNKHQTPPATRPKRNNGHQEVPAGGSVWDPADGRGAA